MDITFLALWLAGVTVVIWSESQPDPYLIHVKGITDPQPYSAMRVAVLSGVVTVHAAGFWALTRAWTRRPFTRGTVLLQTLALIVWFAVTLVEVLFSMHAPPAIAAYTRWLISLGPALFGLAVIMGVVHVLETRRMRRAEDVAG